jgi:ketose-bisphosphate aldolase
MFRRPENLFTMSHLLQTAERGGYAIGAFSARMTPFIGSILRTGQKLQSPLMVQITPVELGWFKLTLDEFASAFWQTLEAEKITIPVGLHLDHTQDFSVIEQAIANGFTSVMIDASAKPYAENVEITREVVAYAHARGVSVEGELGRIGSADQMETQTDEELFTDPLEALQFVKETGVDALAVSVGTSHGVYTVRKPRVEVKVLQAIRQRTSVQLVIHGGSGTPSELLMPAIRMQGGGISKINIATDLELGFLKALGREDHLSSDAEGLALPQADLQRGLAAVDAVVEDKILNYLLSQQHAADFKVHL